MSIKETFNQIFMLSFLKHIFVHFLLMISTGVALSACYSFGPKSTQLNNRTAQSQKSELKNYISLDLEYTPYKNLLEKLNLTLKTQLKNRGEAHITVITPPEFNELIKSVDATLIHDEWSNWTKKSFKNLCLGVGQIIENAQTLQTYYIVVESSDLILFRQYLKEKYNAVHFKAELYYPHITIGFTDRDLHFEQGVIKNLKSCPSNLQKVMHK